MKAFTHPEAAFTEHPLNSYTIRTREGVLVHSVYSVLVNELAWGREYIRWFSGGFYTFFLDPSL